MKPSVSQALAQLQGMQENVIATLSDWIRVPSVKADPEPGAPFGAAVRIMLDKALSDLEELGFHTVNLDGYAGYADLGEGSDEDALAILSHLDVVPAGDGWVRPPFDATLENGVLYGRGTSDDKGPAVAALYAMLAVKRAGLALKNKVRLILGCDEESGWDDIDYYKKHAVMPRMGFSPDACYPVINIEKGICHISLRAPYAAGEGLQVLSIHVGERTNVVPGMASARVSGSDDLITRVDAYAASVGEHISAKRDGDAVVITAQGIPGHAAMPEECKNAIGLLLKTLEALGADGVLRTLARAVGTESDGTSLGVAVRDKASGALTCNLGILRYDAENGLYATLDIRYPIMTNTDALTANIRAALEGVDVTVESIKAPHHVRADSPLVCALRAAYEAETGLDSTPIAIGGGTYARALREGVAFGATFPGDPDLAHQADENMTVDSLMRSARIFVRAIAALAGADEA